MLAIQNILSYWNPYNPATVRTAGHTKIFTKCLEAHTHGINIEGASSAPKQASGSKTILSWIQQSDDAKAMVFVMLPAAAGFLVSVLWEKFVDNGQPAATPAGYSVNLEY